MALAVGDRICQAMADCELGTLAYRQGDFEQARRFYEAYLDQARAEGNRRWTASALTNLASIAQTTGDFAVSRIQHTESLGLWRELGDRIGEARTLHNLANLAFSEGELEQARLHFEQSLAIKRRLADHYGISNSLAGLGEVAKDQGDYAAAAAYLRESLTLALGQKARTPLVDTLHILIELGRALGELELATRLHGALAQAREELNYPIPPIHRVEYAQIQSGLKEALGQERYETVRAEGRALSLEEVTACLEAMLTQKAL